MKTFLKITTMIFAALLIIGCEEEINVLQPLDTGHVQLQSSSTVSVSETSTTGVSFKVQLGTMVNSRGYTAKFSVTSDDDSRFSVSPSNGEVYFEPNSYEETITIVPVNNITADGNITLTLTLTDENGGVYGNDELKSVEMIILDDDCPTVIAEEYNVRLYVIIGGTEYGPTEHSVKPIAVPGTETTYYIDNLWGPDYINYFYSLYGYNTNYGGYEYETLLTIEDDFTVTFTPQNSAGYTWAGADDPVASGGSGTYSACDDEWVLYPEDANWFISFNGFVTKAILTKK